MRRGLEPVLHDLVRVDRLRLARQERLADRPEAPATVRVVAADPVAERRPVDGVVAEEAEPGASSANGRERQCGGSVRR